MPTVSNVSKPAYVYDAGTDAWIPVGVGVHTHSDAVQTSNYFTAGKNKIINGDFNINQRNFTSVTTNNTYGFDRWRLDCSGGTVTYSAQTFTPGTAPVAGYEGKNFARIAISGQSGVGDFATLLQGIEDVRTFAGQTVTVSFWAKASSGTPKISVLIDQIFGTGGSAAVQTYSTVTISTSWTRYSATINVPSISGKTIGANSTCMLDLFVSLGSNYPTYGNIGIQNTTIDIWGVQVEAGSAATPFTTATGTLQGELAACQRYYQRIGGNAAYERIGLGAGQASTVQAPIVHKVTMRVAPTSIDYSTLGVFDGINALISASAVTLDTPGKDLSVVNLTVSSPITYRPYQVLTNNSTSGYLGFSAEL